MEAVAVAILMGAPPRERVLDAITAFRDRGTATRHATVRAAAQGAGLKHRWYSRDGDDAGLG
jgi:hypothetical protein